MKFNSYGCSFRRYSLYAETDFPLRETARPAEFFSDSQEYTNSYNYANLVRCACYLTLERSAVVYFLFLFKAASFPVLRLICIQTPLTEEIHDGSLRLHVQRGTCVPYIIGEAFIFKYLKSRYRSFNCVYSGSNVPWIAPQNAASSGFIHWSFI